MMHPDKQEIQSDIEAIERNEALDEEANFVDRAEAIDFIEFHIIDRIDGMLRDSKQVENLTELRRRAQSLKNRLEEIDEALFRRLRANIRSGNCTCKDLKRQFSEYVERAPRDESQVDIGYDALDTFVNDLLRIDVALKETKQREPDMVFLQPTPARIVLELVEKANIVKGDVFYDLGSGLGQVPILVRLLTGAKTKGVEFEPAYCDYAQQCARRFNLLHVEFINLDARDADYSDGTIFFMYTPFTGKLLQEVLEKLEGESRKRSIKICTYGPCTPHVSNQSWLRRIDQVEQNADHEYELAIFKSVQEK
jgi:SAM-dependent methyltransferase